MYKKIESQHPSGKESFKELGCKLEDNIKSDLEEVDMDSIAIHKKCPKENF
jgi:hypothetical protein